MAEKFAPDAKLKIDLGGDWVFNGSIREACRINSSDPGILREQAEDHASNLAWLGVLKAKAALAKKEAAATLATIIAETDAAARREFDGKSVKYTEKVIAGIVDLSPRVDSARENLQAREFDYDATEALFDAYRQRKDLIATLSNDLISERGGFK